MVRRPRRTVVAALLALCMSGSVVTAPASPVAATTMPGTHAAVMIRGLGYGHGRGLSQWGSWGWATHPDRAVRKDWLGILDFYYGGGGRILVSYQVGGVAADASDMSVRLTALDGQFTSVFAETAVLQASWAGGSTANHGGIVAVPRGDGRYDVWASATPRCAVTAGELAGMTPIASGVTGPVTMWTSSSRVPTAGANALPAVCEPISGGVRIRHYRGELRAVRDGDGAARTANIAPLGLYLRGVVPRESPASWGTEAGGAGMNALRAQAVAARSYALRQSRYSYAKSCDSQSCQVYGGAFLRTRAADGSWPITRLEQDTTNQAIAETANYVMVGPDGVPLSTEYTSSNGGRTAGGAFLAREDAGDLYAASVYGKVTNHSWTRVLSQTDIEAKYPSIGSFTSITTVTDGLGGAWGGYALRVEIRGTSGTVTRSGWDFRSDWDLHNPWFEAVAIPAPSIVANPVGSILYVGDSVSLGSAAEFDDVLKTAYPAFTHISCQGRQMVGGACSPAIGGAFDRDGLGVVDLMGSSVLPLHDIVVIALGYNDAAGGFDQEVSSMVAALKAKGVKRILFVNLSAGRLASDTRYVTHNQVLEQVRASEPDLVRILHWNLSTADPARWRWFANSSATDIHLNPSGRAELALFIRYHLDVMRGAGDLTPANMAPVAIVPGVPIRNGSQGFHVRKLQETINARLRSTKTTFRIKRKTKSKVGVDGRFGAESVAAVIALQKRYSLPATGIVDRATWEAIFRGSATSNAVLRIRGRGYPASRHPDVVTLRAALGRIYRKKLGTSATYDTALANWVRRFQRANGYKVTGTVNARLMRAILLAAAR